MSRRQVYVLVGRWRAGEGLVSDLLPGTSSGGRGGGRLPDEVEARVILHRSWEKALEDGEAWFQAARTDPTVARQVLDTLTRCTRTREEYDRERDFMTANGIPGSFLPRWPARGRTGLA